MWENAADWAMEAIAFASVVVAVVAVVLGRADAKRSAAEVWEANDLTLKAITKAGHLQAAASTAARAAERSAAAAEAAEQRQKVAETQRLEVHRVNMEPYWSDDFDQAAGFQALIGASLAFVNTGPDDAYGVRVAAYTVDGVHDWTHYLGPMRVGLPVAAVPLTDEATSEFLRSSPQNPYTSRVTMSMAYRWATQQMAFHFTWKSTEGVPREGTCVLAPKFPGAEQSEYNLAIMNLSITE